MAPAAATAATDRHAARRTRMAARHLAIVEEHLAAGGTYADLNVEDIIGRDGIARSTFYRYFTDKGELLAALSEQVLDDIIAVTQRMWELPPDATRADLRAAIAANFATFRPHTGLLNAVVETAPFSEPVRDRFAAGFARVQAAAADAIAGGQRDGYVRAELDPHATAGWLTWMAERGMNQLVAFADEAGVRAHEETVTAIVWFTLYAGQGRKET
jgi:AcrR family transcriptional regulator